MKTLGLIGGMSWESTIPYYRIINETVRERRGGQRCRDHSRVLSVRAATCAS